MGRFKRKKAQEALAKLKAESALATGQSSCENENIVGNITLSLVAAVAQSNGFRKSQGFSMGDRKILQGYLRAYREGAFTLLLWKSTSVTAGLDETTPVTVKIADCILPLLKAETFSQPYLILPKAFSSKQRRIVHEMCTDLGLYHVGVGPTSADRFVAISIYHDGFEYIPEMNHQRSPPSQQHSASTSLSRLSKLKPWGIGMASSNGEGSSKNREEATKIGRSAIYKLIDQPRECLRDGVDFLDFKEMEGEDLSKTTPPTFIGDAWVLVDSSSTMRQCASDLEASCITELAFDLECFNRSKYTQMTCLLQLAASNGKEYVIDPLAPGVWELVHLLAPIFADPKVVKIGHSIGGLDVRCLHRDFGIFVVNAFDTYEAARCLRLPSKGLAKVCDHYGLPNCGIYETLKAEYQTTDWTHRPLTEPMIRYGRYDVHYLIQLRRLMLRDLAKPELWEKERQHAEAQRVKNSLEHMLRHFDEDEENFDSNRNDNDTDDEGFATPTEENSVYEDAVEGDTVYHVEEKQYLYDATELRMNLDVMQALSRSQERCLDLWKMHTEPALKNSEFQSLLVRCKRDGLDWTSAQLQLYQQLAQWREDVAKEERCTGGFVCSLGFLAAVALHRPTSKSGLRRISYTLPGAFDDSPEYLNTLFNLVRKSRFEDDLSRAESESDYPSCSNLQVQCNTSQDRNGPAPQDKKSQEDSSRVLTFLGIVGIAGSAVVVFFVFLNKNKRHRR